MRATFCLRVQSESGLRTDTPPGSIKDTAEASLCFFHRTQSGVCSKYGTIYAWGLVEMLAAVLANAERHLPTTGLGLNKAKTQPGWFVNSFILPEGIPGRRDGACNRHDGPGLHHKSIAEQVRSQSDRYLYEDVPVLRNKLGIKDRLLAS